MSDGSITITGEENIRNARLLALRTALKLEVKTGLQLSHGRSASRMVKEMLGLPKGQRKAKTLEAFENYLRDERGLEV